VKTIGVSAETCRISADFPDPGETEMTGFAASSGTTSSQVECSHGFGQSLRFFLRLKQDDQVCRDR